MKISRSCHFNSTIVVIILAYSFVLPPVWAVGIGTKSEPRLLTVKLHSKKLENTRGATDPASTLIEQVQTTDVRQQVQVRVVGSGSLSCVPFRLCDPEHLALDFAGAHVRAHQRPIRLTLDPVLAVRVSQFTTDVARVVIDLAAHSPYATHADGRSIVVTFDPIHRQPPRLEKSKQSDFPASPAKIQGDRMAPAPVPTRAVPVVMSELAGVQKTKAEPDAPAEKLDSTPPDQDYVIGPQDLLAINVWHEPELSQSVPVRPDGKISLPLIGDMEVSGLTPRALQAKLEKELDAYIHKPQVTVIVREVNSRKFYIIGQVERPGTYSLSAHMTVLDALATAGGFRDFAKVQQIYLLRLRPDGSRNRLHFDYKAAVNGKTGYRDIELEIGDTVVVP